jgi:serine/threonine protein phosphatase 1
MAGWIDRWRGEEVGAAVGPPAPDRPLAIVGDVHGCDDLLGRLLDRLAREEPGRQVVLVGDLIDRGEDSAGVIRRLMGRPTW